MGKGVRWRQIRKRLNRSAKARREMSLRSPVYFDTHYCGMGWADHRERWLNKLAEAWNEARASLDDVASTVQLLMLGPRGHGKTETVITFVTELVLHNRNLRVLFVSEAADTAQKRLGRVKDLLLSDKVQKDWCPDPEDGYGPLLPPKFDKDDRVQWSQRIIQVLRTESHVDPTIEAVGAGKKITGGHFDLIILDDPEDYESTASPILRARRRKWLKSTVMPMLDPGGLLVMIGTRKHHDDLYGHALKDPTWRLIKDVAIRRWPDKFEPIYAVDEYGRQIITGWDVEGDSDVLWKEERPIELLLTMREKMGATNFAREMLNKVQDEETVQFKWDWLQDAAHRGRNLRLGSGPWPSDLLIVQGWDPAFVVDKKKAEAGDRDYSVGVVWGASVKTRERYLLDISRERGDTHVAKKRNVIRFYRKWAPPADEFNLDVVDHVKGQWAFAVAMEKNNAGEFLTINVADEADIPLVRHWTGPDVSDPFKGVPVLATHLEMGRVVLPYADADSRRMIDTVIQEFHELGSAAHDDIVLAVWIAEVLMRRSLLLYDRFVEKHGAPDLAA